MIVNVFCYFASCQRLSLMRSYKAKLQLSFCFNPVHYSKQFLGNIVLGDIVLMRSRILL